jgi:hypothetical protein
MPVPENRTPGTSVRNGPGAYIGGWPMRIAFRIAEIV